MNDKLYALPFWVDMRALLIRQDLFHKAGVSIEDLRTIKYWNKLLNKLHKYSKKDQKLISVIGMPKGLNPNYRESNVIWDDPKIVFTVKNDNKQQYEIKEYGTGIKIVFQHIIRWNGSVNIKKIPYGGIEVKLRVPRYIWKKPE